MIPAINPGSTIGLLGGGQLGRMLALAARRMGYRIHTLAPEDDPPAGQVSDLAINAAYDDLEAVRAFARGVDIVTFEVENVPAATARATEEFAPVRPSGWALHISQQRAREKGYLADRGLPVTPFARVSSADELAEALARIGCPAVLKTVAAGHAGEGQLPIASVEDGPRAWQALGGHEAVLEAFVDLACELSVVGARGLAGEFSWFGPIQNSHRHHILDLSFAPAAVDDRVGRDAVDITRQVVETLDFVGVLCVEFFYARDGRLLINELAPRPHNSGHLTIDACRTSQFEQHVRAICGLPLGSPQLLRPAAMANLLGELWGPGEPNWRAACAIPEIKLHLYGKRIPRPGRKMGHLTAMATDAEGAVALVQRARAALVEPLH